SIAWLFSGEANQAIWWLGRAVTYPLEIGSASSIYFSERLYEFPQGMLGLAIATAAYPILSKHAAMRNFRAIADELGFGLRMIITLAIPAGVGLMMLSENFAHLLYQRGAFTPSDTFRTADMIFWFSFGVCGFCTIPLLVRSFYAMGDIRTPLRIGFICCTFNFVFGLAIIWVMKENGLALAASIAATLQAVLLFFAFCIKHHWLDVKRISLAAIRSAAASAIMGLVVEMILENVHGYSSLADIVRIMLSVFFGSITFGIILFILGGREIEAILRLGNRFKKNKSQEKQKNSNRRRKK
ncbi:MAG: murein biosynthesis integral membrane protein MurJ, partial [Thermoguttaceae bacterium]